MKPLRLLAWKSKSAVEHPLPTFLYPGCHVAFRIAPFYWPVIESQAVLTDLDKAKAGIVARVQPIPLGGDAIAVELSLVPIGIVIKLFHDVQNGARDNVRVVRIEAFESIDNLTDLFPGECFDCARERTTRKYRSLRPVLP